MRGFAALTCGQGIRIAGYVVLVPVYLHYWPATLYGEWLALGSLATYLSALDLGVNTAGVNRLTQEYARDDLAAYARYQASALMFYAGLAGVGGLLLAVAVWQLPVSAWLGLRTISAGDTAWVAWFLGLQALVALPVGFLSALYRTTGRLAGSEWLANARSVVALGLVPLVLSWGGGIRALAASQLVPLGGVALFVAWHGWRRWPELTPRLTEARRAAMRELAAPSLLFATITLANAVALQGTVLLVVNRMGGTAVAIFVTSRTLTSLVRQAVFTVNNTVWPYLTAMEATGDYRRIRLMHRFLVSGSSALSVAFAAALWEVGDEVIATWTGGKLAADAALLKLLLLQVVLQAPWVASSVVPVACNRPRPVALASAVSSVLGLAAAGILIDRHGLAAIPLGLIVGEALACYLVVPRAACRLIGESYGRFAARQGMALAVSIALAFGAATSVAGLVRGPLGVRWLAVGVAALAGSLVAAWFVGLGSDERRVVIREGQASLGRVNLPGTPQRA